MLIKLDHIITAIKALQTAERAMETGIQESRAITECLIARARLEAAIGAESVTVVEAT